MLKLITSWFFIVLASPFIVLIGENQYQEIGWLAIGQYDFNIYHGLYRSAYFFVITLPVVISLYLGRPKFTASLHSFKIKLKVIIRPSHIILMILFCLTSFYFNLGITGVEIDTNGWRLSGIVHYIRSYLFLFFLSIYIFNSKNISIPLVILYALVSGLTAGSRFVIVAPLVLLLLKNIQESGGKIFNLRLLFIVALIAIFFSIITTARLVLLSENYTFDSIMSIYNATEFKADELGLLGITQLFLRLGIGRDVILSYQIASSPECKDILSLFIGSSSCLNPSLDFYGIDLVDSKFGLSPPMLSSLFAISDNFIIKLIVSFFYSAICYFFCVFVRILKTKPFDDILIYPAYFLIIVFVTIGPIYYCWIFIGLILIFRIALSIIKNIYCNLRYSFK
jgi:hypothetical protein